VRLGALAALLTILPAALRAQDQVARARDLLRRGQLDSAYALIQRAVEAEPARAEAHYGLGEIAGAKAGADGGLGALGTARRSKAGYARAVELEPNNVQYLSGLAGFLAQAPGIVGGDRDSALVLAERVRRLDPARGTFMLASMLRRGDAREQTRADSIVESYERSRAGERAVQMRAAGYWAQTDRPERALVIYERLLARDSSDALVRYGVARNLVVLQREPRRAQGHLRWVVAHPPTGEAAANFNLAGLWWRLGQTWVQLGQPDSARAAYQRALGISPQFRQARQSLDSLGAR